MGASNHFHYLFSYRRPSCYIVFEFNIIIDSNTPIGWEQPNHLVRQKVPKSRSAYLVLALKETWNTQKLKNHWMNHINHEQFWIFLNTGFRLNLNLSPKIGPWEESPQMLFQHCQNQNQDPIFITPFGLIFDLLQGEKRFLLH